MARPRSQWLNLGDPNDPEGLIAYRERYLEALRVRNYAPGSLRGHNTHFLPFLQWSTERGLRKPREITADHLDRYKAWMFRYRSIRGTGFSTVYQAQLIGTIRNWFRWLHRKGFIPSNPGAELELPRLGQPLPRTIFNIVEIEQIFAIPDLATPIGLRDRAILELLYSTGVRRSEAANLELRDVDEVRGVVYVRHGKGDKDRVVPIGKRALMWVNKYLEDGRMKLLRDPTDSGVFISKHGGRICSAVVGTVVTQSIKAAMLGKEASAHALRHSMATSMLENGCDVRILQEMLGHGSLKTTQIYTHVSIAKLKEAHQATHPTADLKPRQPSPSNVQPPLPPAPPQGEEPQ